MSDTVRVLIVDDSPVARGLLKSGLEAEPGLEVVGAVADGEAALAVLDRLQPDVITMDVIMPRMDGYQAVEAIMKKRPTPILVVTDIEPTAVIFRMLSAGAVDVARKPLGRGDALRALAERVKLLGNVNMDAAVRRQMSERFARWDPHGTSPLVLPAKGTLRTARFPVVVLSASAGGPRALAQVLGRFPPNMKAAVLIVQHIPPDFGPGLADWLTEVTNHRIRLARSGEVMRPGQFYLAPGDYHLEVSLQNTLRLSQTAFVNGVRPSADVTLKTAAHFLGDRVIAAVLTGMGTDGAEGAQFVKQKGGQVVVQDEATSLIYSMPKAARAASDAERPIEEISTWILRRLRDMQWQIPQS